jgi:8-oxo-dGTP pyrophosphatase MutT (NUDIX family)
MPIPDFVAKLRAHIGHDLLWLPSATAVVFDARHRVLLGRRSDTGAWQLPGGIVDPAEQPADAAIREVFEETGVIAEPERLVAVSVTPAFAYPNGDQVQYLDLLFRCRAVGGAARVNDAESSEVGWYAAAALPPVSERTLEFLSQAAADAVATDYVFSGISAAIGDQR